ncbi:MAG: transposase [Acidimicrobiales bacterium]
MNTGHSNRWDGAVLAELSGTQDPLSRDDRPRAALDPDVLHTDGAQLYRGFRGYFASHESVDHIAGECMRDGALQTDKAENFFSQLKRWIHGTHHVGTKGHLHRYLGEFAFRYSTRGDSDEDHMAAIVHRIAGRRLSYAALLSHSPLAV